MHQFFYGMAVASLGLAVVVTFPTPPGAMRPFSGSRTSVMLSHFVRAVIPRSMRLIIRNCRPRARRRKSTPRNTTKRWRKASLRGISPWNPRSARRCSHRPRRLTRTRPCNSKPRRQPSLGGSLTVTVTTKGGIGPVVGVMLLDEPLRFQARPIQGTGWFIANAPEVIGPDGKPQSTWLDRRVNKQQTNLNFILVYDMPADPAKDMYDACVLCAASPSRPLANTR